MNSKVETLKPEQTITNLQASWLMRRFRQRLARSLHSGQLTVKLPGQKIFVLEGREDLHLNATLEVKNYRLLHKVIGGGAIGFAESYMDGDWDSPDLSALLTLLAGNLENFRRHFQGGRLVRAWNRLLHLSRRNNKAGSRRNIAYHYDLGNDFYALCLDRTMTYSAACFTAQHNSLEAAQEEKYRRLADSLGLKPGDHVLEIGCGWGGFAEFAARRYGCRITGVTLSREQLAWAKRRIERAGLGHLCEFRYQDYREISGTFDHIVSIEMFEAVGEEHWPLYFGQLQQLLKEDGRIALQIITINENRFEDYRRGSDFIQKYIFPGGLLPSPERVETLAERHGFSLLDRNDYGADYARTLHLWRKAFDASQEEVRALGYPERFRRMWRYYLCYCEAGFRRNCIDVSHFILGKQN